MPEKQLFREIGEWEMERRKLFESYQLAREQGVSGITFAPNRRLSIAGEMIGLARDTRDDPHFTFTTRNTVMACSILTPSGMAYALGNFNAHMPYGAAEKLRTDAEREKEYFRKRCAEQSAIDYGRGREGHAFQILAVGITVKDKRGEPVEDVHPCIGCRDALAIHSLTPDEYNAELEANPDSDLQDLIAGRMAEIPVFVARNGCETAVSYPLSELVADRQPCFNGLYLDLAPQTPNVHR